MNKMINTVSALALGLGFAGVAQAQPDGSVVGDPVYITGSTAFRSQVYNGLGDLGLTAAASDKSGSNWFTFSGAVAANAGGITGVTAIPAVTVFCSWSGSMEGVQNLVTPQSATYQNVDGSFYGGTFSHTGADVAFSDIGQTVCYQGIVGSGANPVNYTAHKTGITLQEIRLTADKARKATTGMAIIPFTFVVNNAASGIKNITLTQFEDLWNTGGFGYPLSFFTGSAGDSATPVIPVGRYNLSGTRTAVFTDLGYSLLNDIDQFALSADGTTTPGLASTDTAPPPSGGNQWVEVVNDGYYSGGNVGAAIHASSVNGATAAVAYIGWPDSSKLTGTGGEGPINYEGQVPWVGGTFPNSGGYNINAVINGSYTLWTYERLYASPAVSAGTQTESPGVRMSSAQVQAFAQDLILAIQHEIQNSANYTKFGTQVTGEQTAVNLSQMQVYRTDRKSVV